MKRLQVLCIVLCMRRSQFWFYLKGHQFNRFSGRVTNDNVVNSCEPLAAAAWAEADRGVITGFWSTRREREVVTPWSVMFSRQSVPFGVGVRCVISSQPFEVSAQVLRLLYFKWGLAFSGIKRPPQVAALEGRGGGLLPAAPFPSVCSSSGRGARQNLGDGRARPLGERAVFSWLSGVPSLMRLVGTNSLRTRKQNLF